MPSVRFTRTRLAPTPSGFLHVGNAASFLLTARLAQEHGARTWLRIDDLDRERVRPEYVQDVFDTLNWLGIGWDEGPRDAAEFEKSWSQVHRKNLYAEALSTLKDAGALFACTCSRSQLAAEKGSGYPGTCLHKGLPLETPGASWRIRTDPDACVKLTDLHQGTRKLAIPDPVRFAVVRKKDGEASYHLSSVADDVQFHVDLIVRGEDLFDSTLIQLYIADLLGKEEFRKATFHHHPLLRDAVGVKLSKSEGASSIRAFRAAGGRVQDLMRMT